MLKSIAAAALPLAIVSLAIGTVAIGSTATQAAARPIVLELFTSQGCSSCPPADALLTSLAGRRDLLPLAFHVTYWNGLGWRDPYSTDAATARQAQYAARLGGGSYTPELVVDGRRGVVGSDREDVTSAISAAHGEAQEAVPVHLKRSGNALAISVGAGQGSGQILLVGFDPRHETPVGRGENSGRTLVESNIVRSMQSVGAYTGGALETHAPRGAGSDAAVLVQSPDGRILGAARL